MGNELRVNSSVSIVRNSKLEEQEDSGIRPISAPAQPERALEGRISQARHPQIAWREKELEGFEIHGFFDTIRLIDHLDFFDRNNIPHDKMRLLPRLKQIFTRDINKTLNYILYDKGLSASEKLFASSVYERVTGEKFYLSIFIDELITGSNESIPEIKTEDFYPIPIFLGDADKKLKEGIFTSNFSLVREAIAQGANLNETDKELNWTPLHYAIAVGNVTITYLLLQNGADPNIAHPHVHKTFEWRATSKKKELLLSDHHNRDTTLPKKPLSLFELALQKKHYTILLQLASAGAKFTKEQAKSVENEDTRRSLQNHFDLHFSKTKKSQKSKLATEIRIKAKEIVAEKNANKENKVGEINKDIRFVIPEKRDNPDVVQQFSLDMDRNPAVITYAEGKILTEGLFIGKYLFDHDFLACKTGNRRAVEFLEANLHQGRLADAIGEVKVHALVLGTSKIFTLNNEDVYYDVNPSYTMNVLEGKNPESFKIVVRGNFTHCLTAGNEKIIENYQHLFTIEQTYTIEDGVAVDFSALLI